MPCWPSTTSRPSTGTTCGRQTRSRACSPRSATGRSASRARSPRTPPSFQAHHRGIQNLAQTEGRKPVAQSHPGCQIPRRHRGQRADITQRRLTTSSPKFRHSSAKTGTIVASTLTSKEVDDAAELGPLLDQVEEPLAAVVADGAYDQDRVYDDVAGHSAEAAVVVPPRATAVLSASAETDPTQRDHHIQAIAEQGRMGWQKTSGYNARAGAEGAMSRYKRIIGDTLRSHTRPVQEVETRIAVTILNRMLDLGRPDSVRAA